MRLPCGRPIHPTTETTDMDRSYSIDMFLGKESECGVQRRSVLDMEAFTSTRQLNGVGKMGTLRLLQRTLRI